MSKLDERVLCIPRARWEELGAFQGSTAAVDRYVPALFAGPHPQFIARRDCEDDPSQKQLIPYLLVESGGRLLRYWRGGAGGEARLHAKASVGIGGHVNAEDLGADDEDASTHAAEIFRRGLERELDEELDLAGGLPELTPLGLINDDADPVGQVHLGLVYLARFADGVEPLTRDAALEGAEFVSLEALEADAQRLESWSQLALELYRLPIGR